MKKRLLGNSDLNITMIGFGAWAIGGGDWQFGWGTQDEADSIAAIQHALDHGINWIDTAAVYGLGHSEKVIAKALKDWSGPKPYLFTKCGMPWNDKREISYSTKATSVRKELEDSLRRLKVDVIDLYQIHWPADDLAETVEGWTELTKLQKEGKIRWIGVSNFSPDELHVIQALSPITSLQPPYSLLRRDIEKDHLPFCQKEKIGVLAYSPMASGLLTGAMTRERIAALPSDDWRRSSPEFKDPKLTRNLLLVDRLRKIGLAHGKSPGEVAIAWALRNPVVTGAIVGARTAKQVDGFIGVGDFTLSPEVIAEIEAA